MLIAAMATPRTEARDDAAYRQLFEIHPEPLWVYDRETLQFLTVNQAAIDHYGYSRDTFLAMTTAALDPPGQATATIPDAPANTVSHRCADGRCILVQITTYPLEFQGRPAAAVIARDITTELQAEARACEREYLLTIAGRIARLGGWSADLQTQQMQWSPQVYAIHDLTPSNATTSIEAGIRFYAPEDRDRIRHLFKACAEQGQPYDEELQIITAQGRRRWVRTIGEAVRDQAGAIVRVQGAFQDITDQKHTEQALVLSKRRFRQFADAMPQIIWTATPEGLVDYANAAFYTYLGAEVGSQPTLQNWLYYLHPEDVERTYQAWQTAIRCGEPHRIEYRLRRADGNYRWHFVTCLAIRDETGAITKWFGTGLDIHDRRLAEAQAQDYAERLNRTLESINEGLFTLDDQWCFTFLNPKAEKLLRRSRQELLGRCVWDEFPEAINTLPYQEYHRAVATGQATAFEFFYEPLATWFEASAYPSPEGLAVYFRDVTERHDREMQLRESEARFRAVARATADVIWDWDLKSGLTWWSEGFQTVFGYAPEDIEATYESWVSRLHPEDLEAVWSDIEDAIANRQELWQGQYRFRHQNGSWLHIRDRGYLIFDANGEPSRFVGGMTDITEHLTLAEQLRQAQRLETVGQLTGGVAHDFNNLLTVILGNTELLAEQLEAQPNLQALATMAQAAAQRGAELTHRLLAFARRQALAPQVVKVNALLASLDTLLRRTLPSQIALELVQGGGLWDCLIDPAQLEAAILNLCLNARDAMPEGGKLTLETANAHLDQDYAEQHAEVTPGQYVLIAITDTGSGIPPDLLDRVFDPFFTTKTADKGTGLGLSMVYGFVKQSGGHVKLYSEVEQGTTVKLYLPRALQGTEVLPVPSPTTGLPRGRETILVVEDNDLVQAYVDNQLRSLGYQVIAVQTGVEALAVLEQEPAIDLLFTDVMMPGGMNGKQLAEKARQQRQDLSVLYTSGYTENAIVHQGRLDPGVYLLSKPYRLRDLARMVRQALTPRRTP